MGKQKDRNPPHQFYVDVNPERPLKRACMEMLSRIEEAARANLVLNPDSLFERFVVKRNDKIYPEQALVAVPRALAQAFSSLPHVAAVTTKLQDMKDIDLVAWQLAPEVLRNGSRFTSTPDGRLCVQGAQDKELTVALVTLAVGTKKLRQNLIECAVRAAREMNEENNLEWKVSAPYHNGFLVDVRFNRLYGAEKKLSSFGQVVRVSRIWSSSGQILPALKNT